MSSFRVLGLLCRAQAFFFRDCFGFFELKIYSIVRAQQGNIRIPPERCILIPMAPMLQRSPCGMSHCGLSHTTTQHLFSDHEPEIDPDPKHEELKSERSKTTHYCNQKDGESGQEHTVVVRMNRTAGAKTVHGHSLESHHVNSFPARASEKYIMKSHRSFIQPVCTPK